MLTKTHYPHPRRVMAPPFYTTPGRISFNFTGFVDAHSGPLSYMWGVGSAPGAVDVLPAVRYNGAWRSRTASA